VLAQHVVDAHGALPDDVQIVLGLFRRGHCGAGCKHTDNPRPRTDPWGGLIGHDDCPAMACHAATRARVAWARDQCTAVCDHLHPAPGWETGDQPEFRAASLMKGIVSAAATGAYGTVESLALELLTPPASFTDPERHRARETTQEHLEWVSVQRATTFLANGELANARGALSPGTIAPLSEETYTAQMQSLFPAPVPETRGFYWLIPPDAPYDDPLDADSVRTLLHDRRAKAAGPAGWAVGYAALERICGLGDEWARAVTLVMQLFADGWLNRSSAGVRYRAGRVNLIAKPRAPDAPPDAPPKFRPVTILEPLHNLPRTVWARRLSRELAAKYPYDSGYGGPDGGPRNVETARYVLAQETANLEPDTADPVVLVHLDARQAYSSIHLGTLVARLSDFPDPPTRDAARRLLRATSSAVLGHTAYTHLDDGTLKTFERKRGVPMGDPVSSLLYQLAMQPTLNKARASHRVPFLGSHIDDIFFVCRLSAVKPTYDDICKGASEVGVSFDNGKLRIYSPSPLSLPPARAALQQLEDVGVPPTAVSLDGILILGAPIGKHEFIVARTEGVAAKLQEATMKLLRVVERGPPRSQHRRGQKNHARFKNPTQHQLNNAYRLLTACIPPGLVYLQRTLPPDRTLAAATLVDESVAAAAISLMGPIAPVKPEEWDGMVARLNLPVPHGGAGLPCARHGSFTQRMNAVFAYGVEAVTPPGVPVPTGALQRSAAHMSCEGFATALDQTEKLARRGLPAGETAPRFEEYVRQAAAGTLSHRSREEGLGGILGAAAARQHEQAMRHAPLEEQALHRSMCGKDTGLAFTVAAPREALLSDEAFAVQLALRAGAPIFPRDVDGACVMCPMCQKTELDQLGLHALCCPSSQDLRTERHTEVQDVLQNSFRSELLVDVSRAPVYQDAFPAGSPFAFVQRPGGPSAHPIRKADLAIKMRGVGGPPALVDVTVAAISKTLPPNAATSIGAVAREAERTKLVSLQRDVTLPHNHTDVLFIAGMEAPAGTRSARMDLLISAITETARLKANRRVREAATPREEARARRDMERRTGVLLAATVQECVSQEYGRMGRRLRNAARSHGATPMQPLTVKRARPGVGTHAPA
jgi:hypothetical protein